MVLVIIEAPGKVKWLSSLFWQSGLKDCEVLATRGHICANPQALHPLCISSTLKETSYTLKEDRFHLAEAVKEKAHDAKKIYLATDDDQEGDVIARDVLYKCIDVEDHPKVFRLRLRALSIAEIGDSLKNASPFDPMTAAKGDARRIIDRIIGAYSNENAVVGRVLGSTLVALRSKVPLKGYATLTIKASQGNDWQAVLPVYMGQEPPSETALDIVANVDPQRVFTTVYAEKPYNHDEILLTASLQTKLSVSQVSEITQDLYERGKMTYPRAKGHFISQDSYKRLEAMALRSGATFSGSNFTARSATDTSAHEAPNPTEIDVPVNRPLDFLSVEDQVLVHIARRLIECGVVCRIEAPEQLALAELPSELASLTWYRVVPIGQTLWDKPPTMAGYTELTQEQSLLHFMISNGLGRPSTVVHHLQKFLARNLVDKQFELTEKGQI